MQQGIGPLRSIAGIPIFQRLRRVGRFGKKESLPARITDGESALSHCPTSGSPTARYETSCAPRCCPPAGPLIHRRDADGSTLTATGPSEGPNDYRLPRMRRTLVAVLPRLLVSFLFTHRPDDKRRIAARARAINGLRSAIPSSAAGLPRRPPGSTPGIFSRGAAGRGIFTFSKRRPAISFRFATTR